jgi:DNA-binding CsgD family transcriptional regulator/N-acetylneuraminic acid mutarotase
MEFFVLKMVENQELSERELEILKLVATGASNKEIAQRLYISPNTVKVHLKKVFSKIGVVSRTEAAMYAVQTGIITSATPVNGIASQSLNDVEKGNLEEVTNRRGILTSKSLATILPYRGVVALILFASILILLWIAFFRNSNPGRIAPIPTTSALPRWQRRSDMPTARFGLAGAAFENQIYAIGGETANGLTGVVEKYNPESDAWTQMARKPIPVSDIGAVVIGGRIFVPGGKLANGNVTDVMEVYNPREDTWERGPSLPVGMSAYAIAAYEGKLYIFGGWDGINYLDRTFEYDPGSDRWSERSRLPGPRGSAGAAVAGGKIYILGGYDGKTAFVSNEIYSPEMDAGKELPWQKGSDLPVGGYAMGVTSVADKVYIVGGKRDNSAQNASTESSFEYSPFENNFRLLENPAIESRTSLTLVSNGVFIYAIGGNINSTVIAKNFRYQVFYTVALPVIR